MNMFRRIALSTTMALSLGAVSFGQHYTQTNLQANASGVAEATDPQLVNSWGLSRSSGSTWWVADNANGNRYPVQRPRNETILDRHHPTC
jgi:hypothetical protein